MDKGTTIVTVVIIAILTVPFIIISLIKNLKNIKLRKEFLAIAKKENLKVSDRELWDNHYIIGIDYESGKLIYLKRKRSIEQPVIINLAEVTQCKIVTTDKTHKSEFGDTGLTYRLDLVFSINGSTDAVRAIEFFNNPDFTPTPDSFSIIEKWAGIVNANLKKGNPGK